MSTSPSVLIPKVHDISLITWSTSSYRTGGVSNIYELRLLGISYCFNLFFSFVSLISVYHETTDAIVDIDIVFQHDLCRIMIEPLEVRD
jgi:hypothetical protein